MRIEYRIAEKKSIKISVFFQKNFVKKCRAQQKKNRPAVGICGAAVRPRKRLFIFLLYGSILQGRADGVVAERGNAFFAHGMHERIEGRAERIDPKRFGDGKRAEVRPIGRGEGAVGEISAQEHDDHGNDKRVDEDGEQAADRDAQHVIAEEFSHAPGTERGEEGSQRADEHVVDPEGGRDIAQHTADVQSGDRFREKQGKDRERFGGTDL